jgi:DNA-binding response OmpR family regulator
MAMSNLVFSNVIVLVVDDDEVICLAVGDTLRKLGCVVFTAANGNEGLALFQRENPDLVITDLMMPEKEGLETIQEMRAFNPHVKIIAMSGGGSTQDMSFLRYSEKMGASCTMAKPIAPGQLIDTVRGLLSI